MYRPGLTEEFLLPMFLVTKHRITINTNCIKFIYFLTFQSFRTYTKQQRHPVNCNSCSWCGCGHSNFQIDSCCLAWGCIDRLSQNHWMHLKQEAQLWQRDHAKLDTFSINVQRYSQNHAQNWIFGPPYGDIRRNICALSEIFNKKKTCSRDSSRECQFYSYNN